MARSFVANTANRLTRGAAVVTAVPITFACWLQNRDAADTRIAIVALQDGTANDFELAWRSAGTLAAIASDGGTLGRSEITAPAFDEWHHAAAVFVTNSSRFVYLDGVAGVEDTTAVTPTGLNQFYLGVINGGSFTNPWHGLLAEAAVWTVDLSAAEIQRLADGESPEFIQPGNLAAYWPLCGRSAPNELDRSTNLRHLSIVGSVPFGTHPGGAFDVQSPCPQLYQNHLRPAAFSPGFGR